MSSLDDSADESSEMISISKADLEKAERRFVAKKNEVAKWKQFTTDLEKQLQEYKDRYENTRKQLDEADAKLLNAVRPPSNSPDNTTSTPARGQNIEPPTVLTSASSVSDLQQTTHTFTRPCTKPPTFTLSGNIDIFLKKLDNYFKMYSTPLSDSDKIYILKGNLDDITFEIVQHLPIPADKTDDYDYYRKICKERFEPATSINERRLQFRNEKQTTNETFDAYYEKLLTAAAKAFPNSSDANDLDINICDQFIAGMSDQGIKIKLLETPPKNSRDALATAKRLKAAQSFGKVTQQQNLPETAMTMFSSRGRTPRRSQQFGQRRNARPPSRTPDGKPICFRCGKPNHVAAHCRTPSTTVDRGRSSRGQFQQYNNFSRRPVSPGRSLSRSPPSNTSPAWRARVPTSARAIRHQSARNNHLSLRSRDDNESYHFHSDVDDDSATYNKRSDTKPKHIYSVGDGKISSLYARGYVQKVLVYLNVDTGSTLSLMSKEFYDYMCQVNSNFTFELKPVKSVLRGITNNTLNVLGMVTLDIRLTNKDDCFIEYSHDFIVADNCAAHCLLGVDFFEKYNAKIDLPARKLALDNGRVITKYPLVDKPYQDSPVSVNLADIYVIKPGTQQFVQCRLNHSECDINDDWEDVKHVVFTPHEQLFLKYNLMVANCVTPTMYGHLYVHVANFTDTDIQLHPATNFGSVEPYDEPDIANANNINMYNVDDPTNDNVHDTNGQHVYKHNKHVSFGGEQHIEYDDNFELVSNVNVTTNTLQWIKESGLDCDFTHFTDKQKQDALQLLTDYRDVFAQNDHDYGRTHIIQHRINTGNAPPVQLGPHRMSPPQRAIIEQQVQEMLSDGIIEQSTGEFSSPVVLVKKKDGSHRFCVDYRLLNFRTIKDRWPLSRIEDCHDSLHGATIFSTLDMQAGYWQIEVAPEDRHKTAFTCHAGNYQFRVLPYGLCNAPSCFSRAMDVMLHKLKYKTCLVYLDDIIVFGNSPEQHFERLREVLQRIRDAGFKLKPRKSHLFKPRVEYLGHEVSKYGLSPMPSKVAAIREFPTPRSVKQVRSFLGLASFYRKYIKSFATIAKPLHKLTEKSSHKEFKWTSEHDQAFSALKNSLAHEVTLAFPDFSRQFRVATDASGVGIGAVISQIQHDGQERPISFISRVLTKTEQKYSTIERELLAIIWALEQFKCYLYGQRFVLQTDHAPLTYLKTNTCPSSRLSRWLMKLSEYDIEPQYKPGVDNVIADTLSRSPLPSAILSVTERQIVELDGTITQHEIEDAQYEDATLQHFRENALTDQSPVNTTLRTLYRRFDDIFEEDGVLYIVDHGLCKAILPPKLHATALYELHNQPQAGHLGTDKTLEKIRERYYWPGLYSIVADYVKKCRDCAMYKRSYLNTTPPLVPIISSAPMQLIECDVVGPLPTTHKKNKYIFTIIDTFTRYPECYAIPNQETPTIIECLEDFISRHSVPAAILTDRGRNFESHLFQAFCQAYGINKKRTTSYAPQTNGNIERFNGTLVKIIAKYTASHQKDWDTWIAPALMAYRTSVHAVTKVTPFKMLYGRNSTLTTDLHHQQPLQEDITPEGHANKLKSRLKTMYKEVREVQEKEKKTMKERYDQKYATDFSYKVGEKVWLNSLARTKGKCPKLQVLFKGPYIILRRIGPVDYEIRLPNGRQSVIVHQRRLKPCYEENENSEIETDSDMPELEDIPGAVATEPDNISQSDDAPNMSPNEHPIVNTPIVQPSDNEWDDTDYEDDWYYISPQERKAEQKALAREQQQMRRTTTTVRPLRNQHKRAMQLNRPLPMQSNSDSDTEPGIQNTPSPPATPIINHRMPASTKPAVTSRSTARASPPANISLQQQRSDSAPSPHRVNENMPLQHMNENAPRRSARQRRAPLRYSPSNACFHITTQDVKSLPSLQRKALHNFLSMCKSAIIILILFSLCTFGQCENINAQTNLANSIGPAKICSRGKDAILFSLSNPPDCKIPTQEYNIVPILIQPFFQKTLSPTFTLFTCTIEIESTTTYMSFFGSKGITNHSITFKPIEDQTCRQLAYNIKNNLKHNLQQLDPYTYVNKTNTVTNYVWCCKDITQINYKLIVQQIFGAFNYHTRKLFSASLTLSSCDPTKLSCIVNDHVIVWDNDTYESCELIAGEKVIGELRGNELMSNTAQLALTLNGKVGIYCDIFQLKETYEGVLISFEILSKNASKSPFIDATNTHNTFSTVDKSTTFLTTISYVERYLEYLVQDSFTKAWINICNIQKSRYYHLKSITPGSGTTIAMRTILQTEDIIADLRGDLLFIWPCTIITNYTIRTETDCHENIPISFELNGHLVNNAFLHATNTREITYNDLPQQCDRIHISYFKSQSDYVQWNGKHLTNITLHVTDISMAVQFKDHEHFHLTASKIYDENTEAIDHLLDLTQLSNKVDALTQLLTLSTNDGTFDPETVKSLASQLGQTTHKVINSTFSFINNLLPPRWLIYLCIIIILVLIFGSFALSIFFRLKPQTLTINKPTSTTDTDPVQNTTRNTEQACIEIENEISHTQTDRPNAIKKQQTNLLEYQQKITSATNRPKTKQPLHPLVISFRELLAQENSE